MKKAIMLMGVIAVCLTASIPAFAAERTFRDVPANYWAYADIERAYQDRVITGTSPGMFSPEDDLTLAQFVTIMTRAFYQDELTGPAAAGAWYSKSLAVANRHNLMEGLRGYQMNACATRYQMAVIIANILKDQGCKMPTDREILSASKKIGDNSKIPVSYRNAVATVVCLGIIQGTDHYGTFHGLATMKRSHAAVIYARTSDAIELLTDRNIVRGDTALILKRGGTLLPDGDPASYVTRDGVRYKQFTSKNRSADTSYRLDEYAVGNQDVLRSSQREKLGMLINGEYPKNKHGESYGPDSLAPYVGYHPDLVSARATNGMHGYVYFSDLNASYFKGLSEAQCPHEVLIAVRDVDGTKIGEMPIGCGGHGKIPPSK